MNASRGFAVAAVACALTFLPGCLSAPAASTDPSPLPAEPPVVEPGRDGGLSSAEQSEIDAAVAAFREARMAAPRADERPAGTGAAARPPSAIERVSWLDPGGTGVVTAEAVVERPVAAAPEAAAPPTAAASAPVAIAVAAPPLPAVEVEAGPDEPDLVTIANVQLCRSVGGFGVYEPFASTTFTAGRPVQMVLYAEIEGFGTDTSPVPDATAEEDAVLHRVRLEQEVLLFRDADGLVVWSRPAEAIEDSSRRRRRDFWSVQLLELPANLGVGRYRLKVRLTDKVSGTVDERSLPLRLVADASAE